MKRSREPREELITPPSRQSPSYQPAKPAEHNHVKHHEKPTQEPTKAKPIEIVPNKEKAPEISPVKREEKREEVIPLKQEQPSSKPSQAWLLNKMVSIQGCSVIIVLVMSGFKSFWVLVYI